MTEKSFVFVKPPHSANNGASILAHLEDLLTEVTHFSRLSQVKLAFPPVELLECHYAHCRQYDFFNKMVHDINVGGVVVAIYEGTDVVRDIVLATGKTDPLSCERWQIRRKYSRAPEGIAYSPDGCDSADASAREKRYVDNVIHRSGSPAEALKEIELWLEFMLVNGIYQPIK